MIPKRLRGVPFRLSMGVALLVAVSLTAGSIDVQAARCGAPYPPGEPVCSLASDQLVNRALVEPAPVSKPPSVRAESIDRLELLQAFPIGFAVNALAMSADGAWIVVGGRGDRLISYDFRRVQRAGVYACSNVKSLGYSRDGRYVACGQPGGESQGLAFRIHLWDSQRMDPPLPVLQLSHDNAMVDVNAIAFSPREDEMVTAGNDRNLRFWSVPSGDAKRVFATSGNVNALAYDPGGGYLLLGLSDRSARILSAYTGEEIWNTMLTDSANAVSYSADGAVITAGSYDGQVQIWSTSPFGLLAVVQHEGLASVAVSADGSLVATGSWDRTIRLWKVQTGALLRTLEGHGNVVTGLAFSPDGTKLASASHDETVRIWGFP